MNMINLSSARKGSNKLCYMERTYITHRPNFRKAPSELKPIS